MAQVVLLALGAALLLAFTLVPALVAVVLRPKPTEQESPVMARARRLYLPWLRWALALRRQVLIGAGGLLAICLVLAGRLGSEFIPTLDEHDIAIQALRIPGTSVEQAVAMQHDVERAIGSFPEVAFVFARIGTAEVANDPMPPNIADVYVILKPREAWPNRRRSKTDLIAALERRLELLPGNAYEYTQPIEMRFNELIAGVRGDVAVRVFGDDLEPMVDTGNRIAEELRATRGAADVRVEQVSGQPTLTVDIDRAASARFGLSVADVQAVLRTALAGSEAREVFEGDRGFEVVVRLPETVRRDLRALEMLPVPVEAAPRSAVAMRAAGGARRGAYRVRTTRGRGPDSARGGSESGKPRERQASGGGPGERPRPRPGRFRDRSATPDRSVRLPAGGLLAHLGGASSRT